MCTLSYSLITFVKYADTFIVRYNLFEIILYSCPNSSNLLFYGNLISDVPQLTVRLGKKLRHSHIREGSDVFLECDVKANPSIIEMGWRFEGKELTPKSESVRGKKGIIISEHSLVLQNVTR